MLLFDPIARRAGGQRAVAAASFAATAVAALLLACSAGAAAQPVEWQGELALASELTDRGLVVGPRRALLQGQLSAYLGSQWSASLAASAQREGLRYSRVLARLGRNWTLSNDWQLDTGLSYYAYPGDSSQRRYDRFEAAAVAGYRDVLSLGLTALHYAERSHGLPWAADLGLRWPLAGVVSGLGAPAEAWSLTASVGRATLLQATAFHYSYGSLGLAWQQGAWRAEVNRLAADGKAGAWVGRPQPARWAAVLARNF